MTAAATREHLKPKKATMTQTESPLVSVITPTFNHEHYIGPCIESVLQQSHQNWEQIIVDDGSTDATARVVASYSDQRIRYLHQENQGIEALPHTYNRALDLCRGDFIAILEGDDLWPADKLTHLMPGFIDNEVVLAYGLAGEVSLDGTWGGQLTRSTRQRRNLPLSLLSNSPVGSATLHILSGNDLVPPSTAIIRRSALEKIGGFQYVPGLCVTDFPTFLRLTLEGTFHYSPKIMGFRRRHTGSVTLNNMGTILRVAHQHSMDFVRTHQPPLNESDSEAITRGWRLIQSTGAFTEGRFKLVQRQWKQARKCFVRSADPFQPRILLASVLGWSSSWLHRDLEWAMRAAGRAVLSA